MLWMCIMWVDNIPFGCVGAFEVDCINCKLCEYKKECEKYTERCHPTKNRY